MKRILFFSISFLFLIACGPVKLTPEEKIARQQQVRHNIEAAHYTIEVNQMKPLRGKTINLSTSYSLTVRNDSAISYLPFFGHATHAPFAGSDGGITFAEKMENYKMISLSEREGWLIQFDINSREYNYKLRIKVYDSGESTIDVNSIQRDLISFSGELQWTFDED